MRDETILTENEVVKASSKDYSITIKKNKADVANFTLLLRRSMCVFVFVCLCLCLWVCLDKADVANFTLLLKRSMCVFVHVSVFVFGTTFTNPSLRESIVFLLEDLFLDFFVSWFLCFFVCLFVCYHISHKLDLISQFPFVGVYNTFKYESSLHFSIIGSLIQKCDDF
jgi:hypothetical protein